MSVPNPIQGVTSLNVGSTTTYTDSTPAGAWSSTNTGVMTIVAGTGIATAVAAGSVQIVYTVGGNATALSITVISTAVTNGINYDLVYNALNTRVLWRSQGLVSDSRRYYEDFFVLNNTDILDAVRPVNGETLTQYLNDKQSAVIMDCINSVYCDPEVVDLAQLAFYRLAGNQLPLQYVANNNQFVGLRLDIGKGDYSIKCNSLQLCFSKDTNVNLYLYNDMIADPILTIPVFAKGAVFPTASPNSMNAVLNQTIVQLGDDVILSNLVPAQYKQGTWYWGYRQADIINPALGNDPTCQAIYYPVNYNRFKTCSILAFSANTFLDANGNTNFYRNNIGANNLMYGMNLEITAFKDATNNIVQSANAGLWDNLIGQRMNFKVCDDCKFSYQINSVQQAIQGLGGLDELNKLQNGLPVDFVNGRPRVVGFIDKINQEISRVKQGMQKEVKISI